LLIAGGGGGGGYRYGGGGGGSCGTDGQGGNLPGCGSCWNWDVN